MFNREPLLTNPASCGSLLPAIPKDPEDRRMRWGALNRLLRTIPQYRLLDCYAAANVFVFASRTETQGLVLREAMA